MIINTSQGDIEVIGDIKEFKTSVDPKNLEFITTLLSSNLYSNPEQSFIREIVSNAWDSHVEAKNTKEPVIIRFKGSWGNSSVTIRDYGTGLSPERFKEVYCNIGSSTKRESNDFIGGFGIGKYSSLACSNTVYITSYYEGIAYYYVMIKSGNSITTNLLLEKATKEKNGVEVTIKNLTTLETYKNVLRSIVFFPNIYIDGAGVSGDNINNAKIKKFTNFAVSSVSVDNKLLLGNVLYPCDRNHFSSEVNTFLDNIKYSGIAIKFEVGEINITPNRENIIYSSDTIKLIEKRVLDTKQEIEDMIKLKYAKDYTNIEEYYKLVSSTITYDPLTDDLAPYRGYTVRLHSIDNDVTFKGKDLRSYLYEINALLCFTLPKCKGVVYDGKVYTATSAPLNANDLKKVRNKNILVIQNNTRLMAVIKAYLRDNYPNYAIIDNLSFEDFKMGALQMGVIRDLDTDIKDFILSEMYNYLSSKFTYINFETNKDFLDFKEDYFKVNQLDKVRIKNIILYRVYKNGYRHKQVFKSTIEMVNYLKGLKQGVIVGTMDIDDTVFGTIADKKDYILIKARKDIVNEIKELNLDCVISPEFLIKDDPVLPKLNAINSCFPEGLDHWLIVELCKTIPKHLATEFLQIADIYGKYCGFVYKNLSKNSGIDAHTESVCKKLAKYLTWYKEAKKLAGSSSDDKDVISAILLKKKSYRINKSSYESMKNNELIRILCRK